jgi:hypothetical protein
MITYEPNITQQQKPRITERRKNGMKKETNTQANQGIAISTIMTALVLLGYSIITMTVLSGCGGGGGIDTVDSAQFSMTLAASPEALAPEEYGTITCTLKHRTANSKTTEPVRQHEVRFALVQNESGGSLTPVNPVTDDNGQVTCIYRSGKNEGIDIVQATIPEEIMTRVSIFVSKAESTTTTTTTIPTTTTTTLPQDTNDDAGHDANQLIKKYA